MTPSTGWNHATRHADEIRETALERLIGNGVLELKDDRFLWIFGSKRYLVVDQEVERELVERIRTVLLSEVIPDPEDIIITLADGCGLIGPLLSSDEAARAAPRLELVRMMDLIGRAFLNAMDVAVQPAAGRLDRS